MDYAPLGQLKLKGRLAEETGLSLALMKTSRIHGPSTPSSTGSWMKLLWKWVCAWSMAFTRSLSSVMPMTALALWEILPKNYYTILDHNSEIHVSGSL